MTTDDLRRKMQKLRKEMPEPPPPVCEVCGHSIARIALLREPGEEHCPACREARANYQRKHGRSVAAVRVVPAPSREELLAQELAREAGAWLSARERREDRS